MLKESRVYEPAPSDAVLVKTVASNLAPFSSMTPKAERVLSSTDRKATEERVIRTLNSRSINSRSLALKILCRSGGPGAGRHIANVLNGDCSIKEKLLAVTAIRSISRRTGLYYQDGIGALEHARNNDQSKTVRKAAKRARERIPGIQILAIIPGIGIDGRILADKTVRPQGHRNKV